MANHSQLTRSADINRFSNINPTNENFFTGSVQTGAHTLDPYVSGYAFIFWLKVPSWIQDGETFKKYSQKNFKSFQGLNNIDLETEGVKMGFTQNETHYTKGIGTKPAEFTLKYQEHSGGLMTSTYNSWVTGIRDPRTGIATYPAKHNMQYHSANHTGTLLYVVTRPDADNFAGKDGGSIEFAGLWTHVQPKRINLEHFNYEHGNHDFYDLDQPFTGYLNFGPKVETFARQKAVDLLKNSYAFTTEADFANMNTYTG